MKKRPEDPGHETAEGIVERKRQLTDNLHQTTEYLGT
jgi:hypothetical protein